MEGIIYKWTNIENNKSYIGKSFNKQCRYDWFLDFDIHYAGPHIDRARKKYNDIKYWNYEILFTKEGKDRKELNEIINNKEKYFIKLYKSNNRDLGYNISSGGTWGDTYTNLTQEEREYRINKQKATNKIKKYKWMFNGDKEKKVPLIEQQEYLDNGWQYGKSKISIEKTKNGLYEYNHRPDILEQRKIQKEQTKLRQEQEKERKKEEWHNSQEYKDKIQRNKERSKEQITKYNKSEKHKQAAIESNKRRWKNGCPKETLEKFSKAKSEYFKKHKIKYVNKDGVIKAVEDFELDKYLSEGWNRGYGIPSWNSKKNIKNMK